MKLAAYNGDPRKYFVIDKSHKDAYVKDGYNIIDVFDTYTSQNIIRLYTDTGKPFQFSPPWCGCFERLHSVEIVHYYKRYEY